MKIINRAKNYFSITEIILWCSSVVLIILSFLIFDKENYLTLLASLIGVTSLIFCAKGNSVGQVLMIIFSLLYGMISFSYSYFGEMITYLGMTLPMAVFSLISWLRNPYNGNRAQVKVNRLQKKEYVFALFLTAVISLVFYFILDIFNTANIILSTFSIATSFLAVYLTFRRSPFFALVYASNDTILICLWILASFDNARYIAVVVCFIAFWFNDLYGFINWKNMQKNQEISSM